MIEKAKSFLIIINLIATFFIGSVVFGRIIFGNEINPFQRISVGMLEQDVTTILGNPERIIENKEYSKLAKESKYVKGSYRHLMLPVENKVIIYQQKADTYYFIFIDNNEKVDKIFIGNSDVLPYWY